MPEKSYTINDRRGKKPQVEVCRVCGSTTVHARQYNQPTMECIKYLRERIAALESDEAMILKQPSA